MCRCKCGNEVEVTAGMLRAGLKTDCGCVGNPRRTGKTLRHVELRRIAARAMHDAGATQKEIRDILQVSQQLVSWYLGN